MSVYTILGLVLAIAVLAGVTGMLLTRRLREKYAVLWLVLGVILLVLVLVPGLLSSLTSWLGFVVPANMFFAAAIVTLLGIALHLSWELSESEEEGRKAAEQIAILGARVDALEAAMTTRRDSGEHEPPQSSAS